MANRAKNARKASPRRRQRYGLFGLRANASGPHPREVVGSPSRGTWRGYLPMSCAMRSSMAAGLSGFSRNMFTGKKLSSRSLLENLPT